MAITKDMNIADILNQHPETVELFFGMGMHCLGCPSAKGETLEEACTSHGVDVEEFLGRLNTKIEEK